MPANESSRLVFAEGHSTLYGDLDIMARALVRGPLFEDDSLIDELRPIFERIKADVDLCAAITTRRRRELEAQAGSRSESGSEEEATTVASDKGKEPETERAGDTDTAGGDERTARYPFRHGRISASRALLEQGYNDPSWRTAIESLGEAAWEGSGAYGRLWKPVEDQRERLAKKYPKAAMEIEELASLGGEAVWRAVQFGAVIGYALAQTYPRALHELESWAEDALDFAGIRNYPDVEEGAGDEEAARKKAV